MKRAFVTVSLLAALIVHAALGAPARASVGLEAAACCGRECAHTCSVSDATRCCGVRVADDLAVTSLTGKARAPAFVADASCASVLLSGETRLGCSTNRTLLRDRPAPIFLLVRSLRL